MKKLDVPANALCTIIIQNTSLDTSYYGGVRKKGSSLDYKSKLSHKGLKSFKVNADSDSEIEIFAEDNKYIKFTLTGYFSKT